MNQATLIGTLTGISVMAFAIAVSMGSRSLSAARARRRFRKLPSAHRLPFSTDKRQISFVVVCVSAVVTLSEGIVPALVVLTGGLVTIRVVFIAALHRKQARYEKAIPFALDDAARSLRSGGGILQALSEASSNTRGGLGDDLKVVVREIELGRGIEEALDDWTLRRPYAAVQLCTGAITLALETGGAHAQAIDSVARTLRQQFNSAEMAKSAAAEFQMTSYALSVIPLMITAGVILVDAFARNFFFHTTVGNIVLVVGLLMNFAGLLAMNEMIRRTSR